MVRSAIAGQFLAATGLERLREQAANARLKHL